MISTPIENGEHKNKKEIAANGGCKRHSLLMAGCKD
jgi:hypothetical protein